MGARRRFACVVSATAAAMLSAGGAWAVTSHVPAASGHSVTVADDSSTSSSSDATDTSESSTSVSTDTTDTTDSTVVDDTTTSTVAEPETSTTEPEKVTDPTECKPGWGWGDKNHCHSGPPGLNKTKHGKAKHHGKKP